VTTHHLVARAAGARWSPAPAPLTAGAQGYQGWSVVDASTAAVHTGFGLGRLAPGGRLPAHVHSYEESLYVLDGEVVVQTPGEAALLGPGDYGVIPVGVPHSLRSGGAAEARWARLSAPTPRPDHDGDTYLVDDLADSEPRRVDVRDPRTRRYGHIAPEHLVPGAVTAETLAVSASQRTALHVYGGDAGISLKMMIDGDLGAVLSTTFMVQYQRSGFAGPHDHPFEETYLIVEGAVEGTFDGTAYELVAGDVAWAGVGCVHGFRNVSDAPVRWLETQAPQPPARHSYRFARDWTYLAEVGTPRPEGGDA
jgi:quercetin dioxygenase-like cupin family protein